MSHSGAVEPRLDRRRALGALLALAAVGAGCHRGAPASGPRRVVSISPSTTEAVYAIGAGAELVGRSAFCDWPPEAVGLPAVGGFADPNVEAILALAPTLVVGAHGPAGPALERTLNEHAVATYFPETESLAQIGAMIEGLGRLVDRADAGRAAATALAGRCDAVTAVASRLPRVRAAMLFDVAPIVAAGPGGFPDELLRRANADNVVTAGGAYPTLGIERLLVLDPDVLVDGASTGHAGSPSRVLAMRDAAGWRELGAMRRGAVRVLEGSAALRPGPRIDEGLAALARALHGSAFSPGAPP